MVRMMPSGALESIVLALVLAELLGKVCDDPSGQGDIASLHRDIRLLREGPDYRQQRVRCQGRGFIRLGVDNLCFSHDVPGDV